MVNTSKRLEICLKSFLACKRELIAVFLVCMLCAGLFSTYLIVSKSRPDMSMKITTKIYGSYEFYISDIDDKEIEYLSHNDVIDSVQIVYKNKTDLYR